MVGKPVHGHALTGPLQTPTYKSWIAMKSRCDNPRAVRFPLYGAIGIKYCDRWKKFQNFLEDMGERPKGTSIDRFPDGGGNYEPGNCRWATQRDQIRNRKVTRLSLAMATDAVLLVLHGKTKLQAAIIVGIKRQDLYSIFAGKSWNDALDDASKIFAAEQEFLRNKEFSNVD